jgi:hypothetical protein
MDIDWNPFILDGFDRSGTNLTSSMLPREPFPFVRSTVFRLVGAQRQQAMLWRSQ